MPVAEMFIHPQGPTLGASRTPHFLRRAPFANVAQSVEHVHGKDEVVGSIPTIGSINLYTGVQILWCV